MNWTSKITCIVVFLCSLLLIFAMGRTNIRHYKQVKNSIEDIYKDRLIVNAMVFDLAMLLSKKEVAIVSSNKDYFNRTNSSVNIQIKEIIKDFKQTYLTNLEEETLLRFEVGVNELSRVEKRIIFESNGKINQFVFNKLVSLIESLKVDLKTLSGIQLLEGKRKLKRSDEAVEAMELNQKIENYSLLAIGVLIMVILLLPSVSFFRKGEDKLVS